jgi:hypothetical protein
MRAPFEDRMKGPDMFSHEETIRTVGGASAVFSPVIRPLPTSSLRSSRRCPRKVCARGLLCFTRTTPNGRTDSAACPIQNVSVTGIAFEYDEPLKVGSLGSICYRTASGQPVMIGCTIRQCRDMGGGKFVIGAHFDRKLGSEEDKPDRSNSGRDFGYVTRPRRLRTAG